MRLHPRFRLNQLPNDPQQRIFIQFWYSMVHNEAIDSHRPRSMYSINILEELQNLISKTSQLSGIQDDIKLCIIEAAEILKKDKILQKHFSYYYEKIIPCLENILTTILDEKKEKERDKKKKDNSYPYDLVTYYIKDIINQRENYLQSLIDELRIAIFETKSNPDIYNYTSILLSLLIHKDYSIESLFSLANFVLLRKNSHRSFDFSRNFSFLTDLLKQPSTNYDIIFKLEGFKTGKDILIDADNSIFKEEPELTDINFITQRKDQLVSFSKPGNDVLFAHISQTSKDERMACIIARDSISDMLDLISFEIERETVSINRLFVAITHETKKARLFDMPSRIPNPRKDFNTDDFKNFMQFVKDILTDGTIEKESLKRIKSALRFYRMGKDSSNVENKYINWWTGLEYLLRSGEPGAIIGEIEKRLIPVLILGYTSKFLECYKQTLIRCKINPSEGFLNRHNVTNINDLNLTGIFNLIVKETSEYDSIKAQLREYPVVIHHFDWFRHSTKDLASIKKFIERHDESLRKHINRIWRIRCDIVHSAAYELNLTLLCANLEFYLKSLINCILRQFQLNPSISSLTEFFNRAEHYYLILLNDLKNDEEKSFKYLLEDKHF